MDALGKACHSEDCSKTLKIQSGKDAIACTKSQQAKEDVGNSGCRYTASDNKSISLTIFIGLKELPGGAAVTYA
jgi:hypothetical protein